MRAEKRRRKRRNGVRGLEGRYELGKRRRNRKHGSME